MKHKMISLDDVTYERAKRMNNFSAWVRDRINILLEEEEAVAWFHCERCNLGYQLKVSKAKHFCCPPCRETFHLPAMIRES